MPKHETAIYYAADTRLEITSTELQANETFARAKDLDLFDATEEYRLYARAGSNCGLRHFYCRSKTTRALVQRGEISPEHNKRVESLMTQLAEPASSRFRFYSQNYRREERELALVENYAWQKETVLIPNKDLRVRHDIFGMRAGRLGMSSINPWVAIEVIHHHYPSPASFSAMLALSEQIPLIIIFDHVAKTNFFLHIKPGIRRADRSDVRCIFYIFEGQLWENEKPISPLPGVLEVGMKELITKYA